jgi:hypothetical protein
MVRRSGADDTNVTAQVAKSAEGGFNYELWILNYEWKSFKTWRSAVAGVRPWKSTSRFSFIEIQGAPPFMLYGEEEISRGDTEARRGKRMKLGR